MIRDHYRDDVLLQLRKYKELGEQAMAQVDDEQFFRALGDGANSIAVIVKHMAGNMRSRWRDFLTTDGEKPDRHRDTEFELDEADTREALMERWQAGWALAMESIGAVTWHDLERKVTIRREPHTVIEAINRQLVHYAYHVGQIVLLARHFAGDRWRWLSIPPGESAEHEVAKDGSRYKPAS